MMRKVRRFNIATQNKYTGYKHLILSDEELAAFYTRLDHNDYNCLINEYLIIDNDCRETIDYYRWTGSRYVRVSTKSINNDWLGKLTPRNPQQVIALDMLMNNDITIKVLTGKAGSGKSMLMINAAVDLVKRGKFDKIIYIRNNIELAGSKPLGTLPGDAFQKLEGFYMGLNDHLGDLMMFQSKFEFCHLGFMRGRDIKNSIIYLNESENVTCQIAQLLISRVADGSQIFFDGDVSQVDMAIFEKNNGLSKCIEVLRGEPLFGHVELLHCERSATARLADKFNE